MFVLGVDGDDGVAVDVEEGRRIPERGQVQTDGPAKSARLCSIPMNVSFETHNEPVSRLVDTSKVSLV